MAATDKGTLTVTSGAASTANPPIQFFFSRHRHFNTTQCVNRTAFTLCSGQTCVLLTDFVPIHRVIMPDSTSPLLRKDDMLPPLHLGYRISLKQPDLQLTVGAKTPLSLLFSSGILHVRPFVGTHDQLACLMFLQS